MQQKLVLKETSKYAAEFTVKNNTIKVDDLINALSHSHGSLPTKDLSIDVEDDYEDEENFEESRKSKLKEASEIIYPAGSDPSESSALYRKSSSRDSKLVRAHEKVVEGRRNAIRNFHESIDRKATSPNRRFNEALRTPIILDTNSRDKDTSSWKNNRFIDKYEESQKLDFNALLNEGFLG